MRGMDAHRGGIAGGIPFQLRRSIGPAKFVINQLMGRARQWQQAEDPWRVEWITPGINHLDRKMPAALSYRVFPKEAILQTLEHGQIAVPFLHGSDLRDQPALVAQQPNC